ncbi:MAG: D-tyrosyl-tRNA(Tyr) deacylase [Planctomycetia bacterium]|nr:D-tyrosyl-tRNA(Tyr) deacylase [Planctomycetia bacterium]
MRACVQRVSRAEVVVADETIGAIERGLLVLLGVAQGDTPADVDYLVEKVVGLRIFNDADGKMNLSLAEIDGAMLVVSQFTLLGDCRKGKRPSFTEAAEPVSSLALYESFVAGVRARGIVVATGKFRADMAVTLTNDGPVTLLVDSRKNF